MSPEYKTFITKLKDKTKSKMAIWNKTSREDEFILKMAEGSVTVDNWENDNDGANCTDLRIWNNKGEVIDNLTYVSGSPDYRELKDLHEIVKRSYFKIEDTLESFIKELDSKRVTGKEEPEEDDLPF